MNVLMHGTYGLLSQTRIVNSQICHDSHELEVSSNSSNTAIAASSNSSITAVAASSISSITAIAASSNRSITFPQICFAKLEKPKLYLQTSRRFIEIPGVQDEGGRHMAKRNSDPRVAYPEVKLQVRAPVRVVGIVAPFAPLGAGSRGKFVLSSPRDKMGTGDLCRMHQTAVHHGRARQTRDGTVWGL